MLLMDALECRQSSLQKGVSALQQGRHTEYPGGLPNEVYAAIAPITSGYSDRIDRLLYRVREEWNRIDPEAEEEEDEE